MGILTHQIPIAALENTNRRRLICIFGVANSVGWVFPLFRSRLSRVALSPCHLFYREIQAKSKVSPTLEEHAVDYDYVAVPTDDDSSDPVKFTIDDDAEEDYGGSNAVVKGGESSPALSTRSMDGFTMSSKRITTAFSRASSTVLGV